MSIIEHPLARFIAVLAANGVSDPADFAAARLLPFEHRTLRAGAYLIREGGIYPSCAILVDGFAYRQKLTSEGACQIVSIHIPGDALDFQHLYLAESDHDLRMMTDAEVAIISRSAMQELVLARPAVGNSLMRQAMIEVSIMREWTLNIGRRSALSRIAHLMCELAVRMHTRGFADKYIYRFPMTQMQLADATGLTTVHVNRSIKRLTERGLIKRDGRWIIFPDWPKLRNLAAFNDLYLH